MDFIDDYGLVNSRKDEKNAENSLLWSVQNIFLKDKLGMLLEADISIIKSAIDKCRIAPGIYAQNPSYVKDNAIFLTGKDAYMSHDQLTAIMAFSYRYNFDYHKELWKEILRQKLRYNNITPNSPGLSLLHPRDLIYYGVINGSMACICLLPLFICITFVIFLTKYKVRPTFWERLKSGFTLPTRTMIATDGELLTFVRCYAKVNSGFFNWLFRKCTKLINKRFVDVRYFGWKGVFATYFEDQEHPNRVLADRIEW